MVGWLAGWLARWILAASCNSTGCVSIPSSTRYIFNLRNQLHYLKYTCFKAIYPRNFFSFFRNFYQIDKNRSVLYIRNYKDRYFTLEINKIKRRKKRNNSERPFLIRDIDVLKRVAKASDKAPSLIGSPREIDTSAPFPPVWEFSFFVSVSAFVFPRYVLLLFLLALSISLFYVPPPGRRRGCLQFPRAGLLEDSRVPSHRPLGHPTELCPAVSMPTPAR